MTTLTVLMEVMRIFVIQEMIQTEPLNVILIFAGNLSMIIFSFIVKCSKGYQNVTVLCLVKKFQEICLQNKFLK